VQAEVNGTKLGHGSVLIAAITSCTNTSNPTVMIAAGLLARNAVARGLTVPPTVKTSLAPGSRAVTEYLRGAGLLEPLEKLGFGLAGYGCTTCIGNGGDLEPEFNKAIAENQLVAAAVLSGKDVKFSYDHASVLGGLEFGSRRSFRFFLRSGFTWINVKVKGLQSIMPSDNNADITFTDPTLKARFAPTVRLGFTIFF